MTCPTLRQPPWWPPVACGPGGVGAGRGSVPFYDQVILGRGATGIGMHADAYSMPADGVGGEGGGGEGGVPQERLVATCLTIARGCKHVRPPCSLAPRREGVIGIRGDR